MNKRRWSGRILAGCFLAGLCLLAYPAVSSRWNASRQSRAISRYTQQMAQMDASGYAGILERARAYNGALELGEYGSAEAEFLALKKSLEGPAGYLEIPAIDVKLPIYLGTEESVLQAGAGVLAGSSIPIGGDSTHAVLTGHRGLPSATLFTHLDRLEPGDRFCVQVLGETAAYQVTGVQVVEPWQMETLAIQPGEDLCTLVTCTPYGINTQRLLIHGRRAEEQQAETAVLRRDADPLPAVLGAGLLALPGLVSLGGLWAAQDRRRKRRDQWGAFWSSGEEREEHEEAMEQDP